MKPREPEWSYAEKALPDECDVCIIGSGAGGACIAAELAQRFKTIVVLEKGIWRDDPRWPAHFDNDERSSLARTMNRAASPGERDYNQVSFDGGKTFEKRRLGQLFNVVGGYTVFYAGAAWRFRPADFQKRSVYKDALADLVDGLQREGDVDLADWPSPGGRGFYDALEPFYARAEIDLAVSGEDVEPGPAAAARSNKLQPALPYHAINELLANAATSLGWHPFHVPLGISSVGRTDPQTKQDLLKPCVSCNFCSGYPCVWHAKNSVDEVLLRPLRERKNLFISTGKAVRRIAFDGAASSSVRPPSGWVTYAETDRPDVTRVLKARLVVLAAGGVQSPRLLLLSDPGRSVFKSPALGRYLMFHTDDKRGAYFPLTQQGAFAPVMVKKLAVLDHYLRKPSDKFINHYSIQTSSKAGPIVFATKTAVEPSDLPRYPTHYELQTIVEDLPRKSNAVTLDIEDRDEFGDPKARITHRYHPMDLAATAEGLARIDSLIQAAGGTPTSVEAAADQARRVRPNGSHLMGSLRMGGDPRTAFVDENCRSFDVSSLYVADGSVFTTSAGVNPALTIEANAFRVAKHISDNAAFWGLEKLQ